MPIENYDKTLVGKYIREIENPDSIGYKNGRWYKPASEDYDSNNRGFGIDVEYNNDANKLTRNREGQWLTEQEERNLRNKHIDYGLDRLNFWTPKILATPPSEAKQVMAEGMIYRGEGVKTILNNQKLRDAYYSGSDRDFQKAVSDHYKKKNLNERAARHDRFMNAPKPKPTFTKSWKEIDKGLKYDDGGQLDTPKLWDDLSLSEKADVMEVAVRHGLRDLNEIRQAYNDFAENTLEEDTDDNTFKNGGYVPSNSIKKRIANWEGSSMKTNRSFEDEARDFNRVIPEDIRKSLSQQQLDALYSYGYNVGMGNLKKRTLPVLRDYVNGHAGAKDVANGMWASKDNTLRGLRNRRDWERSSFIGNAPAGRQGSVVDDVLNMDLSYLGQQEPLFESNPTEYTTPAWMRTPEIKLDDNNPTMPLNERENAEPVNNGWGLLSLMSSLEEPEDMPFTGYEKPTNRFALGAMDNDSLLDSSWFSDGGYLHGHKFDDGGPDGSINRNYKTANLKDLTERNGLLFDTNELQVADELQRLGADAPMLRDYSTTLPNVTITAKRPNPAEDIDKVILGSMALGTAPIALPEAAASAIVPVNVASDAIAGTTLGKAAIASSPTWGPLVDAGMTSYFGPEGINDIANGNANALTVLEVAPLGRLAKPVYNGLKDTPLSRLVKPVEDIGTSLYDIGTSLYDVRNLKAFNERYGYDYKPKYKMALTKKGRKELDEITNQLVKEHNTFARGVDVNEARKYYGFSSDMPDEEVAEYTLTHAHRPTQENSGGNPNRNPVLYTSNSMELAKGYTNGDGYIGILQRPITYDPSRSKMLKLNDFRFYRNPETRMNLSATTDEPFILRPGEPDFRHERWKGLTARMKRGHVKQAFKPVAPTGLDATASTGATVIPTHLPDDVHFRHYLFMGDDQQPLLNLIKLIKNNEYSNVTDYAKYTPGFSRKKNYGGKLS